MLPFIIWFGGVVSWFAVVGEAMIAAPLWAMTHLDGDGEGMGPRTTHGYIFLLNLIFRPVFMVIGFVLAGAGIMVLGTLLNAMFGVAMQNAQYDSITGIVSILNRHAEHRVEQGAEYHDTRPGQHETNHHEDRPEYQVQQKNIAVRGTRPHPFAVAIQMRHRP